MVKLKMSGDYWAILRPGLSIQGLGPAAADEYTPLKGHSPGGNDPGIWNLVPHFLMQDSFRKKNRGFVSPKVFEDYVLHGYTFPL